MGPDLPVKPVTSVQRFDGRDLGHNPHIAVLGSCKPAISWPACLCCAYCESATPRRRSISGAAKQPPISKTHSAETANLSIGDFVGSAPLRGSWRAEPTKSDHQCRQPEADGGWPPRPGDQLRRLQPITQTDKLAPAHLGRRRQLRADGRAPLLGGIYPNSVSLLIRTGIHQLSRRYSEQFNSNYIAGCSAAWPFSNQKLLI